MKGNKFQEENALYVCGGSAEDTENEKAVTKKTEVVYAIPVSGFTHELKSLMKKYYYDADFLYGEDAIRVRFHNGQIFWLYVKE